MNGWIWKINGLIELNWSGESKLNWIELLCPYHMRLWEVEWLGRIHMEDMYWSCIYWRWMILLYIMIVVEVMMTYRQGRWKRSKFIIRGSQAPGGSDRREKLCGCLFGLSSVEQTSRRESGHMLPGKKTHCSFAIDWVTFRFRSLQGLGLNVQSGQRKHKATWGDGVTFRHSVASSAA